MSLPQTNLQLLDQLRRAAYPAAALAEVGNACWFAADAFAGKVRGSGKPFLCHLVGTAAAAALERPPSPVIVAALCHGIRETGDFGGLSVGRRDDLIADRLGAEAARLLGRYADLQKSRSDRIGALLAMPPESVAETDRWCALIWTANEADDEVDAGARFRQDRPDREQRKAMALALVRHFRWTRLAAVLEEAYRSYEAAHWAENLAAPYTTSVTFARKDRPKPSFAHRCRRLLKRLSQRNAAVNDPSVQPQALVAKRPPT